MMTGAHLWAIGYDEMARADQVRDEITRLGWGTGGVDSYLLLYDIAVVVRHPDGSFTLNREPIPGVANILAWTGVGFFVGLALAAPLAGAAVGALLGGAATAAMAADVGISDDFVREVERLMKPGTSALFILDDVGDQEVILHAIRGLGGTVLKTNVDPERAEADSVDSRCRTRNHQVGHHEPAEEQRATVLRSLVGWKLSLASRLHIPRSVSKGKARRQRDDLNCAFCDPV